MTTTPDATTANAVRRARRLTYGVALLDVVLLLLAIQCLLHLLGR